MDNSILFLSSMLYKSSDFVARCNTDVCWEVSAACSMRKVLTTFCASSNCCCNVSVLCLDFSCCCSFLHVSTTKKKKKKKKFFLKKNSSFLQSKSAYHAIKEEENKQRQRKTSLTAVVIRWCISFSSFKIVSVCITSCFVRINVPARVWKYEMILNMSAHTKNNINQQKFIVKKEIISLYKSRTLHLFVFLFETRC